METHFGMPALPFDQPPPPPPRTNSSSPVRMTCNERGIIRHRPEYAHDEPFREFLVYAGPNLNYINLSCTYQAGLRSIQFLSFEASVRPRLRQQEEETRKTKTTKTKTTGHVQAQLPHVSECAEASIHSPNKNSLYYCGFHFLLHYPIIP